MANIGERAKLPYLREVSAGSFLDGGELGEILLPKGERFNEERELGRRLHLSRLRRSSNRYSKIP
jgi:hypothetical protein